MVASCSFMDINKIAVMSVSCALLAILLASIDENLATIAGFEPQLVPGIGVSVHSACDRCMASWCSPTSALQGTWQMQHAKRKASQQHGVAQLAEGLDALQEGKFVDTRLAGPVQQVATLHRPGAAHAGVLSAPGATQALLLGSVQTPPTACLPPVQAHAQQCAVMHNVQPAGPSGAGLAACK